MTPGGQLSAAIEVLAEIETRHRPAAEALKDYGLSHRFAGSKDRAAIATYVFDALRRRASSAWLMGAETPRAILLGSLARARQLPAADIAGLCNGEQHAPEALSEAEHEALLRQDFTGASPAVLGDFPAWLEPALLRAFAETLEAEMGAIAARAPLDIRVNLLRGTRERAMTTLAHLDPQRTPYAPDALRLPLGPDGRGPALSGEPAFIKGLVEVQDEGSQVATLLAQARPGEQVLDLCAGGGGKTLALAAAMDNRGQVYASDTEGRRLMGLYPRLGKSGARNVQLRAPRRGVPPLDDLQGRCDLVLVDAPCTGTGTWRRNPDAKWRVRPGALEQRLKEQDAVLAQAARYVKPGGRIVYVTCSLLCEENEDRVAHFLAGHEDFSPRSARAVAESAGIPSLAACADTHDVGIRLSPHRTGTDGFFIATLNRR